MKQLEGVISFCSRIMAYLAAICTVAVMIVILMDLGQRTIEGGSLVGAYETVVLLIACIVFLGLPYSELSGSAVRVTLLTDRMNSTMATLTRILSLLFSVALSIWLTIASWQGYDRAMATGDYMPGLISFPIWPVRLTIALGATALSIVLILKVILSAAELLQAAAKQKESSELADEEQKVLVKESDLSKAEQL